MPSANLLSMGTENSVPLMWEPENYMFDIIAQALVPSHPRRTQAWPFVDTSWNQLLDMIPNWRVKFLYPNFSYVIHDKKGG